MTEYESSPQRQQPGGIDAGASDRTSDLPAREEGASPRAGGPESSAPESAQPSSGASAGSPVGPYAPPPGEWSTGHWQRPSSGGPAYQSSWQQPGTGGSTPTPDGPLPSSGAPMYQPGWQPTTSQYPPVGAAGQPVSSGAPGYGSGASGYGSGASSYGGSSYGAPDQAPPIWAPPGPGAVPAGSGRAQPEPGFGGGEHAPSFSAGMPPGSVGSPYAPAGPPAPPSRLGRRILTGAAVLALAVGSGVLGGWVALAADDDTPTTTSAASATNATNADPAPPINRDDLANVAAAVQPSVVSIKTESAEGSGVVYDTQGDIVTNNHVVATARGSTVQVTFNNGKQADAKIVGTDPRTDLAVIKVSNVSGLTAAKLGDSGAMRVGDTVLALGSPLGLEGTVTEGIISALDRTIQAGGEEQESPLPQQQSAGTTIAGLLQTDAAINPGNSGGALANTKGEVIGINSAIATSGNGSTGNIGVGFAIPSNKVKTVADQLIGGGKVSHPFLGVSVGDTPNGALVQSVTAGSPAAKAGIQEGDVITKLGDKAITDSDDLVSAVQNGKVGDKLDVSYTRNGDQKTATVTLAEAS